MSSGMKSCAACGEEILATAKKCKHCGEWLEGNKKTGLTESKIVQVAPDIENEKIKFMECFGWSLSNRQEMSVEGDTSVDLDFMGNAVAKTQVTKYVKLHFTRSLDLPNLQKLKELESKVDSTVIPSKYGLGCPIVLLVIGVIGLAQGVVGMAVFFILGFIWIIFSAKKNADIQLDQDKKWQLINKLMDEAKALLGG